MKAENPARENSAFASIKHYFLPALSHSIVEDVIKKKDVASEARNILFFTILPSPSRSGFADRGGYKPPSVASTT
jgi:hypothetical protein